VVLADDLRLENSRGRTDGIDCGIDALFCDLSWA
jgi:hypothetical protein